MEKNHDFEKFRVRCYHKGELAQRYMPLVARDSAVRTLMRWIYRNSTLHARLRELGYRRTDRMLSAAQVREIVAVLGEP